MKSVFSSQDGKQIFFFFFFTKYHYGGTNMFGNLYCISITIPPLFLLGFPQVLKTSSVTLFTFKAS